MDKCLLDTDTVSEVFKARNDSVRLRAEDYLVHFGRFTVCAPTVFEVVSGYQRSGRPDKIEEFLAHFSSAEVTTIDREVAALAGRIHGELIRQGATIGIIDPLIAASAVRYRLVLVTGNTAHYERVQALGYRLRLDNWREPAAP